MKKCERCKQEHDGDRRICKHCKYILVARIERFKEIGVSTETTKKELRMWGENYDD